MKTSRERTILIAVLAVAGIGLLVDRVVIGSDVTGPAESSAGVVDGFDTDPAGPPSTSTTQLINTLVGDQAPAASNGGGTSFAQRLRLVTGPSAGTDPQQVRDAFKPGPGWAASPSDSGAVTDNQARLAAQAFRSTHVLEAVLVSGDTRYAVIGGQTLSIGQELDGYRLVAVLERSAVFQVHGLRVELGIRSDTPASQ